MLKYYGQFDKNGNIFSVVQSAGKVEGADIVEVNSFDDLGKKWDGSKPVEVIAEKKFKVWSKPDFILALGKNVFDAIVDGTDKDLRFAKYVLDNAGYVDLNVVEYQNLVKLLLAKKIIDQAKFDLIAAKE